MMRYEPSPHGQRRSENLLRKTDLNVIFSIAMEVSLLHTFKSCTSGDASRYLRSAVALCVANWNRSYSELEKRIAMRCDAICHGET